MVERRVMNRGGYFEIEELVDGEWKSICICDTINECKQILRDYKILDGGNEDE